MRKWSILNGVGVFAMATALGATPALASTDEGSDVAGEERPAEELNDISPPSMMSGSGSLVGAIAPINTFAGFDVTGFEARFDSPTDFAIPRLAYETIATGSYAEPRIIARDDVGSGGIVDVDNTQPSVVQIFSQRNSDGAIFFNCTGSVINPRTILTAAHCLTASTTRSSEAYGLPETGAERTMLISSGVDSSVRFFEYLGTGANYAEGGVASSTDVVIHASANVGNGALPFPWADIALIAVDTPITDVPPLPLLLTPLTELTHVVQVGYGTFGTANGIQGGGAEGIGFLRRVGENMLGALASSADLVDSVIPALAPSAATLGFESQPYYFTDFDNPNRTQEEIDGCVFTAGGVSCANLAAVRAIDYFADDALPNEVATAGGDSGSPLIVDQLFDFSLAIGVLSGGFDFFGVPEGYGDISFYNPLYPFFEFITENTAYKYVSANEGDGLWSDPTHWTQDLDPGFFIQLEDGTLVNGVPTGPEPGVYETGPALGTIVGIDISEYPDILTAGLPPQGTPNFGENTPDSSVLLGPGSTGFVPQNTDGTPGTAFANPAQYFEVHLSRAGTTSVDMNVEIDKLVIDNRDAEFDLPQTWSFSSLIGVEQFNGTANIDGTLSTPLYTLAGGQITGDGGTIDTMALFNVSGLLNAGGTFSAGTLNIDGDYIQTSGGALLSNYALGSRRDLIADSYNISGTAILDGLLIVTADRRRVRFGDQYTALTAGAIDGDFSEFAFLTFSPILTAEHRIVGNDVIVEFGAKSIKDLLGPSSSLESLGGALDTLRASNFNAFADMFLIVDNATYDTLGSTLLSLAPMSAFNQTFTANSFAQRFTGQISQRTLALRGGSRALGNFSASGSASYAIAGAPPSEVGKLGMFGSASGMYRNASQQSGLLGSGGFDTLGMNVASAGTPLGANAFEQASLTQAGELTVGADMRVSESFSFGIAVSNIRNSQQSSHMLQPQADQSRSVALYVTYEDRGLFADGYAGTSEQRLGADRLSSGDFQPYYDNAVGQSQGQQTFGGLRFGYAVDLAKGIEAGPVVSMDYVRSDIEGYRELGAGRFGLVIADRTYTSLGAKVGAMASVDIVSSEKSAIRAFGSVAYARELGDTQDTVSAHFFGAPDVPFSIANSLDPQWVSVNAGAEMAVGHNLTASLSITSDMGRGLLSNDQGQVTLGWRF
ncbi:Uncharacterized protein YhjY, contains autotransporter beta-barrel domain [Altererythrobacter xiamenensis]|uniref:Uncharacterized protein YhjY, contains autotransporter beta-barrel domain n=1 Tax=Altererythrobacter xiamenensis TaxID=1316679 RepID=A0A1Y6F464_9SPHN|nr:autotransporter domain-containing protein [Altererythrobacter xiamenensis]SMQ69665.1 Uncharacterized protein YhjY, contains autotransporter beta-barrel domain [Altererythrobacter xiamenensis]